MIRKRAWFLSLALVAAMGACSDDDDNGGGTQPVTPPTAPTGVAASASGADVTVSWTAVTGATAYDVQRQAVGGASFATVGTDVSTTSFTDAGLAPGTYLYRVIARNSGGSSPASDPATIVIEEAMPFANITGTITGERTLSADTTYTLQGIVVVDDGGRLNIPAGTLIFGSTDIQPTALIVRTGGQLFSEGTEDNPVVFTSPAPTPTKGDWGGVVLNGRSICNFPASECIGEGASGPYGGDVLDDNSGRIVFTRIEWAGFEVSFGNELNALTLNGVGSGTEIHHVQTHGGLDDGFEWFGGTVDAKYLIATDISDDSFDFSTGWHGRGQFWIAQQDPDDADNGYEVDGNEDDFDATPWTNPTIYNVTLVGKGPDGSGGTAGESTRGILLRRGTAGLYANHIVTGFGSEGFDVDQLETVARSVADSMNVINSIVFSNAANFSGDDDGIDEEAWFMVAARNNMVVDPMLASPFDRAAPDFRPGAGSPAVGAGATPPADGWFDVVDFIGAVGAGATEWYKAPWTRWGSSGS
ncbi:MAG: hypothetical protein RQ751_00930 [Longimicrobiales bacterium]|nr:hypothetical protein [Longimicrobiales bacterium]